MDPMQRANIKDDSPLFGTSRKAGQIAARSIPRRYERIMEILVETPSTLHELAEHMNVLPNQISGRLTELAREGLIERTGQTRPNPATNSPCDVWRLRESTPSLHDIPELLGYPTTLHVGDDGIFHRVLHSPIAGDEDQPGIAYERDTTSGQLRQLVHLMFVDCPGCGTPLKFILADGRKTFHCGRSGCMQIWELATVRESGGQPILSLVRRTSN